ncbi:hypothetical protein EB796_009980 [Bugula neritina]|uniref:Uncharacterized protein n=1 Tax=Bugula neritina TaxID=10212 RepID=A0A7J7K265_BUGNE|nr:hypothetical protein EB796_009980 [Bugula neritina]
MIVDFLKAIEFCIQTLSHTFDVNDSLSFTLRKNSKIKTKYLKLNVYTCCKCVTVTLTVRLVWRIKQM